MFNSERQAQILSCLEQQNTVSVQALSEQLYASPSTIRRDLSELEAQGFLKRIHGGAVLTAGSTFDTPARLRPDPAVGRKAAHRPAGQPVSEALQFLFLRFQLHLRHAGRRLAGLPDVKIATNGVAILQDMSSSDKVSIISCGGYLRSPWDELTGNIALRAIESMNADFFFFSCAGFSAEQGSMELNDDNVAVKRAFSANPGSTSSSATVRNSTNGFSTTSFPYPNWTM